MQPLTSILNGLTTVGLDLRRLGNSLRGIPTYLTNLRKFRILTQDQHDFPLRRLQPCLTDRYESSGTACGHYFHQDLLVAQWIYENRPERHVDVGSRVDGFVAHVASFREIDVLDIRPLRSTGRNIRFHCTDVMRLDPCWHECTDSLSCLHTLEHFGLGRYGDSLDIQGHLKGWRSLYQMLRPGGRLYFSTPIGPQRIEFDAHRVFSLRYLSDMITPYYTIERFAFVDDEGELHADVDWPAGHINDIFTGRLGCGVFQLRKGTLTPPSGSE